MPQSISHKIAKEFKKRGYETILITFSQKEKWDINFHREAYFYNRGKAILPEPIPECLPCFNSTCTKENFCLALISPERVLEEIKNLGV